MVQFRTITANATSVPVVTKGVDVKALNLVNRTASILFVKFYDSSISTFQDTPVMTFQVKANDSVLLGWQSGPDATIFSTSKGLSVRAVTGNLDNDNTSPGTTPIIELSYEY